MKDLIVSIYSPLLQIGVVIFTIAGFFIGGNSNPFGNFNFGGALIGAIVAFLMSSIINGAALTLDRIREVQEETLFHLRDAERRNLAQTGSATNTTLSPVLRESGLSSTRSTYASRVPSAATMSTGLTNEEM